MRLARVTAPSEPKSLFLVFWLIGSLLLAFILLPLFSLAVTPSAASLARVAQEADVLDALRLSLVAALATAGLAGILGVLWNGARLLHPWEHWLAWLDVRGRIAVAALLAYYLLRLGAPPALWLFVATETGGALLQAWALRRS